MRIFWRVQRLSSRQCHYQLTLTIVAWAVLFHYLMVIQSGNTLATFDQFIASIRLEFGENGAGKPFEVFCKRFLENDPERSKTVDKVWLWDDYQNKWQRQDLGTDLVFRDNEGLIWAVQANCYGEHRTTTKGDMKRFLNEIGRASVDYRLWEQAIRLPK